MVRSYARGHEIVLIDGKWFYADNMSIYDDSRPCKKCGCYPTEDGHDACIGYIEGASSACCGHGVEDRYVIPNKN